MNVVERYSVIVDNSWDQGPRISTIPEPLKCVPSVCARVGSNYSRLPAVAVANSRSLACFCWLLA